MPSYDIKRIKQRYNIIGESPALNDALELALTVANTNNNVLVLGENGVGKEVFYRLIKDNSKRTNKKDVIVNCSAIPKDMAESELFGHVKGAFTDAIADKKGLFEEADKGTIFLDEIGELSLDLQAKLLRVLESGDITRVGSSELRHVNVRVIAATNVDLFKATQEGTFRRDLYYRLNVITLHIPSLRQRKEDIPDLFNFFIQQIATEYKTTAPTIEPEVLDFLQLLPWHGNIRELKNIAQRAFFHSTGSDKINMEIIHKCIDPNMSSELTTHDPKVGIPELMRIILSLKLEIDQIKQHLGINTDTPINTQYMVDHKTNIKLPENNDSHIVRDSDFIEVVPTKNKATKKKNS